MFTASLVPDFQCFSYSLQATFTLLKTLFRTVDLKQEVFENEASVHLQYTVESYAAMCVCVCVCVRVCNN